MPRFSAGRSGDQRLEKPSSSAAIRSAKWASTSFPASLRARPSSIQIAGSSESRSSAIDVKAGGSFPLVGVSLPISLIFRPYSPLPSARRRSCRAAKPACERNPAMSVCTRILLFCERRRARFHFVEAPHLADRGGRPGDCPVVDDAAHRRVAAQPLGVIHVLIAATAPGHEHGHRGL